MRIYYLKVFKFQIEKITKELNDLKKLIEDK